MNPQAPVQGAMQAIQGLSPSQVAPAPAVNTAMPAGYSSGGQLQASSATPTPSQFSANIDRMYAPQIAAEASRRAIQGYIGQNATDVSNAYAQRQAESYNIMGQQNAQNPSNFKKAPSQDGGFNFTDGAGKPITAWQYGSATGQDMSQVLKGSQNPTDQQYIKDESILNNLSNAWYSQDKSAQDKAAVQAGFKDAATLHATLQTQGINSPQDLWKSFMHAYPNVWGSGQGTSVGDQRQSLPQYGQQLGQGQSNFFGG